jgi:hypothetical protein
MQTFVDTLKRVDPMSYDFASLAIPRNVNSNDPSLPFNINMTPVEMNFLVTMWDEMGLTKWTKKPLTRVRGVTCGGVGAAWVVCTRAFGDVVVVVIAGHAGVVFVLRDDAGDARASAIAAEGDVRVDLSVAGDDGASSSSLVPSFSLSLSFSLS